MSLYSKSVLVHITVHVGQASFLVVLFHMVTQSSKSPSLPALGTFMARSEGGIYLTSDHVPLAETESGRPTYGQVRLSLFSLPTQGEAAGLASI